MDETKQVSPLLADEKAIEPPKYDDDELKYMSRVKARLEQARDARDGEHQEFDGMTYLQWHENNEKLANSFVGKKSNKSDVNYSSGTVRDKLFTYLAAINKENLSGGVMAFDREEMMIAALGTGMTDIVRKTEELDMDDEKKMMRQYELLKQGDVFVQEMWKKKFKIEKQLNGKFDGRVQGVTWQKQLKEYLSLPSRDLLWGPGVYLGNIKEYFMTNQPFTFTVDVKSYAETMSMFGTWERWKNVPRDLNSATKTWGASSNATSPFWSITDIEKEQVEIVRYEDKWNNEFMIFLNGIMMLPIGFPLSAISPLGEYTIEHQGFKIIHSKFAYNKSLPMELRNKVAVYDEMTKMAVLKNQQSFAPPMANNTGKVLSSKIFFPGKIINGVDPAKLAMLNEKLAQGVTNGEVAMMNIFKEEIDTSSVNRSFQGQAHSGKGDTATEALQVQEQSALIISLSEFSCSMLEKKLVKLRHLNILQNWFEPVDTVLDEARDVIVNRYRTVNVEGQIPGEGRGRRVVIPTDQMPSNEEIKKREDQSPDAVRFTYLYVPALKAASLVWQYFVEPVPRKSSNARKLMFRAMLADAAAYFQQDLNIDYLEERFAVVWEEDKSKLFRKAPTMTPQDVQALGNGTASGGQDKSVPKSPAAQNNNMPIRTS